MKDAVIYVIDFEGSLKSGILEYGIVGVSLENGIFFTQTKLCKNRQSISNDETACHGIDAHLVEKCKDFSIYIETFLELRSKAYFCAHNAIFENTLLKSYCPVVLHAYGLPDVKQNHWGPWLDTYFLYKKFFNTTCSLSQLIQNCNLSGILFQLAEKFCPPQRKYFHCALFDAIACTILLLNFVRNESIGAKDLGWLLKESNSRRFNQQMQQADLF